MPLIDEQGFVAGTGWSIVDVIVIALMLAFIGAAFAALVGTPLGFSGDTDQRLTVVVESVERPFMADALTDVHDCGRGATVEHVQVVDRITSENRSVDVERIRVRSRLAARRSGGTWFHDAQDVYVGGQIQLDYCSVRLKATVVEIEEVRE